MLNQTIIVERAYVDEAYSDVLSILHELENARFRLTKTANPAQAMTSVDFACAATENLECKIKHMLLQDYQPDGDPEERPKDNRMLASSSTDPEIGKHTRSSLPKYRTTRTKTCCVSTRLCQMRLTKSKRPASVSLQLKAQSPAWTLRFR